MSKKSEGDLRPRNGRTLIVGIVCRISGCTNQKELSLADQQDNAKATIAEMYDGPAEYRVIATIGKGERLDRPELNQINEAYQSGQFDIFMFDDLSRLIRGGEASRLLGVGVDHGTRTICINDGIDTNDETWEEDSLNACSENVAHNQRTSKRIKQKTMNRFKKFGATANRSIAGYIVPKGAQTFAEWKKDDSATPILQHGLEILRRTLNGQAVADHFNNVGFCPGPFCKKTKWDGTMVLRYYRNPLLKGKAARGTKQSVKHHETGRRRPMTNPKGPVLRDEPHLAHLDATEVDAVIALVAERNARYRRKQFNGSDVRKGIPRKRTRSFGQHARCWYCGRHYVWGGNGAKDSLMCSGAREGKCWNSIAVDGVLATEKIVHTIEVRLHATGLKQREIAALLPGKPTQTAVWNALRLQQMMGDRNLSEPYVFVEAPPDDYVKLKRHKHAKYQFLMLEGYARSSL